jgi:prepilin-type processing-associated H-X9-DG protein
VSDRKDAPETISDEALDGVSGGLPAVQAAREAARRASVNFVMADGSVKAGDGSVKPGDGSVKPAVGG